MIPLSALRQALAAYEGWTYAPAVDGVRDCRYAHPIAPRCQPRSRSRADGDPRGREGGVISPGLVQALLP